MPLPHPLHGLTPAVHTPFDADGTLQLDAIEKQADHLAKWNIGTVFACGTTGESSSLTVAERKAMAERWLAVTRGTDLRVVVHVGANCLADARELAAHAQKIG